MKDCKIVKQDGFLVALMPNGELIPNQENLTINNDSSQKGYVQIEVTLKFHVKIEELEL